MDEPKIVIALKKFLADYAWDKSLLARTTTSPISRPADIGSSAMAIEEFINAARK